MSREEAFDRLIRDGLDADTLERWLRQAFDAGWLAAWWDEGYILDREPPNEDEYIARFFGGVSSGDVPREV